MGLLRYGGEGGSRTHEPGFARLPAFEAGSFNRSDTSPRQQRVERLPEGCGTDNAPLRCLLKQAQGREGAAGVQESKEKADSLPARHGGQAAGRLVAWLLGMTTKKEMQIL